MHGIISDIVIFLAGLVLIWSGLVQARAIRIMGNRINRGFPSPDAAIALGVLVVLLGAIFLILDSIVLLLIIALLVGIAVWVTGYFSDIVRFIRH